jgi:hypothetical protein
MDVTFIKFLAALAPAYRSSSRSESMFEGCQYHKLRRIDERRRRQYIGLPEIALLHGDFHTSTAKESAVAK